MAWRALFLVGGILILTGGPMHPGGSMLEMLTHPDWFMGHALMAAGLAALTCGLLVFARTPANGPALRRWTTLAIAGAALMTLEMIVHTAAMVDADHLAAGHSTPVLTTHIVMTVVFYPLFGVTIALFMIAAARRRALGSQVFAWIGVLGAAGNGLAGLLVAGLNVMQARVLFIFIVGVALWMVLAALWPTRAVTPAVAA
jgi:hypothetical protein